MGTYYKSEGWHTAMRCGPWSRGPVHTKDGVVRAGVGHTDVREDSALGSQWGLWMVRGTTSTLPWRAYGPGDSDSASQVSGFQAGDPSLPLQAEDRHGLRTRGAPHHHFPKAGSLC